MPPIDLNDDPNGILVLYLNEDAFSYLNAVNLCFRIFCLGGIPNSKWSIFINRLRRPLFDLT